MEFVWSLPAEGEEKRHCADLCFRAANDSESVELKDCYQFQCEVFAGGCRKLLCLTNLRELGRATERSAGSGSDSQD